MRRGTIARGCDSRGHLLFLSAWSLNSDRRRKSSSACERWPSRSDDPPTTYAAMLRPRPPGSGNGEAMWPTRHRFGRGYPARRHRHHPRRQPRARPQGGGCNSCWHQRTHCPLTSGALIHIYGPPIHIIQRLRTDGNRGAARREREVKSHGKA